MTAAAAAALDDLVTELERRGIAQPQPAGADDRYAMPHWCVPKMEAGQPTGKWRFILDCRQINEYTPRRPTKTEGLPDVPGMTRPGDVGCIQDLKSCYFQFAVHPDDWHYLAFRHRGQLYYLTRLPMGYRLSQYFVIKSTRWILERLRAQGLRLLQYTDDFGLYADPADMPTTLGTWLEWMDDLGLPVSPSKGFRDGRARFILLGLGIDLSRRLFFAPAYKLEQLRGRARALLGHAARHRRWVPRRRLAQVIGIAAALHLAIPTVGFWLASLHRAIDLPPGVPLHRAWQGDTQLTDRALADLQSLIDIPDSATSCPWETDLPDTTAFSDASTTGYGAHSPGLPDVSGHWSLIYTSRDIAMLEARAVRIAIRAWRSALASRTVLWFTDNTTVLRVINHHCTRSEPVMAEYRAIQRDLEAFGITLRGRHVRSEDNDHADDLSRRRDPHEYRLRGLRALCPTDWPTPTHDRFASSRAHQPDLVYDSRFADPAAATIDTLTTRWTGVNWLTPPFNLLATVLTKLRSDGAEAIILVPEWPAQPWWPQLLDMCADSIPITDIGPHIETVTNNVATPEPLRNSGWTFRLAWVRAST